jgi:hypothetical protein
MRGTRKCRMLQKLLRFRMGLSGLFGNRRVLGFGQIVNVLRQALKQMSEFYERIMRPGWRSRCGRVCHRSSFLLRFAGGGAPPPATCLTGTSHH